MNFRELIKGDDFFFLDGAFGTGLQKMGIELGTVPEIINITNPEAVKTLTEEYAKAGSQAVYTCTFGANRYKLEDSGYSVDEIIRAAVENGRSVADKYGILLGLDLGPIGKMLEPNGNLSFEEAYDIYKEQVLAGSGADFIVIETLIDLYEAKAAVLAAKENSDLPVICTMTYEKNGRTFTGSTVSSMALTLEGLGVDAIGFNCSLGPIEIKPLIEELSQWTRLPIVVKANAGLPDPMTDEYSISPEEFADAMADMIPYGLKIAGGCCGTDSRYIEALKKRFENESYTKQTPPVRSAVCTPEKTVEISGPVIIGERLNPTGKKLLKEALLNGDMDYVVEQALAQIEEGAEILDVNVGVPGIDEVSTMVKVVKALQGVVTAPLQIDSNNADVIEAALRIYSGKAIVNSVNGEKSSIKKVLPVVKKYGASVVGLTLDERGIPKTSEQRFEIAEKILKEANDIGIESKDVFIDALTLTVSAEQANAFNTLTAIRRIKEELGLKTVLGVSNISFGLPQRGLINSNFLQMALTAGLDLPIMNPAATDMVRAIDVYKVIANIDRNAATFIEKYKDVIVESNLVSSGTKSKNRDGAAKKIQSSNDNSSLDAMITDPYERFAEDEKEMAHAVEKGLNDRCKKIISSMLSKREPLDIVNNLMIPILDKAGNDFEKGKIFIPQLIMCASTAQIAFEEIKNKLKESSQGGTSLGKIVVATVKGDVHDIGKNIVKVILENYGFEVIDLGKDVPPERVVEAAIDNDVSLVGLSALMTTTLPSMEKTVKMLRESCPQVKIMVGGAVLTEEFAMKMGADFYVKDAKASCDVSKKVYN